MKKLLVMHTGGWIGDMVLLTPALRALKNRFPNSHVSILLLPLVSDVMSRNPYIDEVIIYDKNNREKGLHFMFRMANFLKSKAFDTAIIFHPNSISSAIIAYMAKVPERIGTKLIGNGIFLTERVNRRENIHEVQRYLDLIVPIAGKGYSERLEFWGIMPEDEESIDKILSDFKVNKDDKIVGMNISTTWQTKQWETNKFAHLAEAIYSQLGIKSILTGGKSDILRGQEIMAIAKDSSKYVLDLTGKTTLWQLGAIIMRCDVYITCDSGPMHISAGLGKQTIALFGPTDPLRHRPYGEGHIAIRKYTSCPPCYKRECKRSDCMKSIGVDDIFENVKKLFGLG